MNWTGCDAVESREDKLGGTLVFTGTRIPVATLFENLKAGATVDEFLEWFPGSDREQIEAVLSFISSAA
jgi:uncharacterized protein (DUF433 family)